MLRKTTQVGMKLANIRVDELEEVRPSCAIEISPKPPRATFLSPKDVSVWVQRQRVLFEGRPVRYFRKGRTFGRSAAVVTL